MAKKQNVNSNDDKIMALRKQIADKKAALKASETFNPKTNCAPRFNGETLNLRVLDREKLIELMVSINAWRLSAADLAVTDFKYQGFPIQHWVDDCRARLAIVDRKEEEARLKV